MLKYLDDFVRRVSIAEGRSRRRLGSRALGSPHDVVRVGACEHIPAICSRFRPL